MKLVIVGTGDMGGALATAFVRRSKHEVSVRGSRPGSLSALRLTRRLGIAEAGDRALRDADVGDGERVTFRVFVAKKRRGVRGSRR